MSSVRPQDLYPEFGTFVSDLRAHSERLAFIRLAVETWNPDELRADSGSGWSSDETLVSLIDDLDRAETTLRAATANLESAWAALGRLASD